MCLLMIFIKYEVNKIDLGWYFCFGSNNLGEGFYVRVYLIVKCKWECVVYMWVWII